MIDAAEKEGGVEPLLEELAEIERDVFKPFPRFAELLASARVSPAEKDRILLDVFDNRASSLVLRFLRVLNRHERLGLLRCRGPRGPGHLGSTQPAHPGPGSLGRSAR